MSETIHDAVRDTLDAIKAQHGGSLPDGLEIRHTNTPPYSVGLWCHQCQGYVRRWLVEETEFAVTELWTVPSRVSSEAYHHACWRPAPPGCAGTEGTNTPKPRAIALEWKSDPEDMARRTEEFVAYLRKMVRVRVAQEATGQSGDSGRAVHFREAAAMLRAYPDYQGVMEIAARILDDHATLPHMYKSLLCHGFDHDRCVSDGRGQCKVCSAPCTCRCHGER